VRYLAKILIRKFIQSEEFQELGRHFREEEVNHVETSERCRGLRWVEL
jgi:hypothetical protein